MNGQRGVFLLEALIGILIFSLGILTLVAMQAAAISAQSDSQYRTEVSKRAEQVTNQIWLNVNRTNAASIQASLATFAHHETGSTGSCAYSGTASTNAVVTAWLTTLTSGATALPGTTSAMVQIAIDTTAAAYNKVTVTICWQAPRDLAPRRHTAVTYVN
jgi:type IV pilus assembly protein PilV